MWQDNIITLANLIFAYALIPQVLQGFKEKKAHINFQTGLLTAIGAYTMSFAYYTLHLWFSTIIGTFNATMWLILFLQKILYK